MKPDLTDPPRYVSYPRDPRFGELGRADRLEMLRLGFRRWQVAWIVGLGLVFPYEIAKVAAPAGSVSLWWGVAVISLFFVSALDLRAFRLLAKGFGKPYEFSTLLWLSCAVIRIFLLMAPSPKGLDFGLYFLAFVFANTGLQGLISTRFKEIGVSDFGYTGDRKLRAAIQEVRDQEAEEAAIGVLA